MDVTFEHPYVKLIEVYLPCNSLLVKLFVQIIFLLQTISHPYHFLEILNLHHSDDLLLVISRKLKAGLIAGET